MKEISKAEQMFSNVENEMGRQNISARNDFADTRRMLQGIQELHEKVARIKSCLKQKIEVDSRVTVELRTLQNELDRVQNSIDSVDDTETNARLYEVEQKLNVATQEKARVTNEQDEKRHSMECIRNELRAVNNKIEQLKNVLVKKLALLESYDKDACRVRQFIEQNRDAFSGQIYGPLFVELNVGRNYAKYVEGSISWNDRFAFICEEASDMTKLVQLCRVERNLSFNALKAPPNRGPAREVYKKPFSMSELRSMGLTAYLIDLVEGPEAILRYLCQHCAFHRIPIGTQAVLEERNAQRIADLKINAYYSDKHKILSISSSYSRTTRQKAMLVKEASLFIHDGKADPKLEETAVKLMQNLNKEQSVLLEISTRRKETEERVNELFNERNALRKLKDNAKIMLTKQEKIRREIVSLENSRIDRKSEEQRAYQEIKTVFLKCTGKFEALVDNVNKGQEKMIRNTLLGKKSERLQDDIAAKKEAAKEASQELNTLKTEVADYNQKCVVLKKDADTARKEALAITDNLSPDHAEFGRRFAQAFAKLPDTADDIQQAIINFQAHADCLGVNEQAIVEYEKLKTNILRLKDELQEKTDEFNALKARTGQIKQKWLDELSQLVVTINKSFSAVFRRMGCEGEVSLTNNGNEEDILKFGLTIRVKFREEDELQELDIFRQSGGERAVTIAVFMLSLQELTHVPFRCLDEINQGMDEQNERRVFKTLVETVKRNTSSQYFLLTPKLLNGLKYADEVHSHVIMNGKGAVPDREWSVVSERMARLGIKRRHSDSD
ncbi:structural maintenance of chromosomes protein 5 isoform X2 [Nilaparvata lugens]|uniref:structural maintenance of chromosomes protein 5 isoform X1 n=1 Tax=Nilaparvata lugens TaxID=108931 RepID=UPI00193DC16C|nr:structural maintenance of chromosomes protein 5 isoform X1 [Nilaparvata lugens]XP_039282101.1 structural maintenance of chromosomes protein 5 isoform X2 [Nilaparvata lugens]